MQVCLPIKHASDVPCNSDCTPPLPALEALIGASATRWSLRTIAAFAHSSYPSLFLVSPISKFFPTPAFNSPSLWSLLKLIQTTASNSDHGSRGSIAAPVHILCVAHVPSSLTKPSACRNFAISTQTHFNRSTEDSCIYLPTRLVALIQRRV